MKGGTLQINWHDSKLVLTLDFHPTSGFLATGGADFDIKLWRIDSAADKKVPGATYQNSLSYHSTAVNTLRFSPSGENLASGADGGELILWKLHTTESGQTWKVLKTLSFHRKDVLDLQWSKDGAYIISGSVDNSCLIWDVNKGSVHQILDAHAHYVQGVAWDPLSQYVASLSADRTCKIYGNKPLTKGKTADKVNFVCKHVIRKAEPQSSDDPKSAKNYLFHDDTLPSFFRRLAWSPDGSFLLVPAGSYKFSPTSDPVNTAYIFSRKDFSRPAIQLPGASKPIIAVRFCPVLFSLQGSNSAGFFKLPYRIVFAVATLNSLYIYDTESVPPIAILAGLHYAAITDIAWSANAHFLAVSSRDGYCTLVEFENEELGSRLTDAEEKKISKDEKILPVQGAEEISVKETVTDGEVNAGSESRNAREIEPTPAETNQVMESQNDGSESKRAMETEPALTNKVMESQSTSTPTPTSSSIPSKPAKRRITPIAID